MKMFLFVVFLFTQIQSILFAQDIKGLKFSKAILIQLNSNDINDFIALDTMIVVEKSKVWNITSARAYMVKLYHIPYLADSYSLWLNDQIIYTYKSQFVSPIWLPESKYRLQLKTEIVKDAEYSFNSFISGLEYEVE